MSRQESPPEIEDAIHQFADAFNDMALASLEATRTLVRFGIVVDDAARWLHLERTRKARIAAAALDVGILAVVFSTLYLLLP